MSDDLDIARALFERGWIREDVWQTAQAAHRAGHAILAQMLEAGLVSPEAIAALRQDSGETLPVGSSLASFEGSPQLAGFEFIRELGRGGFGAVHLARAPDGREVAVKVLNEASAEVLGRFEREARMFQELGESGGFVPLESWGHAPQGPFLVMPYIPGGTLEDRLKRGATMELEASAAIVGEVARSLGRAHAQGIVHRDIKPANILFNADDQPLIADMGLARFYDGSGGLGASLSATGFALGTPGYMAPEQLVDAKRAGPAADVFALAATLYKMLTGRRPFEGASVMEIAARQARGEVLPLATFGVDAPALEVLLARCFASEPEARPADGAEFAALLDEALEPPPAQAPGLWLLVAGAALLSLLIVAGVHSLRDAPAPPVNPAEPPVAPTEPAEPPEAPPAPLEAPPRAPGHEDTGDWRRVAVIGDGAGRMRRLVTALRLSPDGRCLASVGVERCLRLWDPETLALRRCILGDDQAQLWSLAFAPDGESAFSGDDDGWVCRWDLASGELRQRFGPLRGKVLSLECGAPGILIASSPMESRAWDIGSGAALALHEELRGGAGALGLVAGGRELIAAARSRLLRVALPSGELLSAATLSEARGGEVSALLPTRDGAEVVLGLTDGRVLQRPLLTAGPTRTLVAAPKTPRPVYDLAWLGDTRLAFTNGLEQLNIVELGAAEAPPLHRHPETLFCLEALPDGRLLSGSLHGTIHAWDFATQEPGALTALHRGELRELGFSSEGSLVSVDERGLVRIHAPEPQPLIDLNAQLSASALSDDGRRLALAVGSTLYLLSLSGNRGLETVAVKQPVVGLIWCGETLVLSKEKSVEFRDLATGQQRHVKVPSATLRGMASLGEHRVVLFIGTSLSVIDLSDSSSQNTRAPQGATELWDVPGPSFAMTGGSSFGLFSVSGGELLTQQGLFLPGSLGAVTVSKDGLAAVSSGVTTSLFEPGTKGSAMAKLQLRETLDVGSRLCFSPAGDELYIGTQRGLIYRYRRSPTGE